MSFLKQLFVKHNLKKADVIVKTGLERTFAYHLLAGSKTFTRDKLLIFAIAAQLTIDETQTLLKYAGEGKLYARDARDGMIIHALNHKLDIWKTNILLEEMGLPELVLIG